MQVHSNKKILLYSASKKDGVYYPKNDPQIEEDTFDRLARESQGIYSFDDYIVDMYDQIGTFYRISPNDFLDTPIYFLKGLRKKMQNKFDNFKEQPITYEQLSFELAIAKAFGGLK